MYKKNIQYKHPVKSICRLFKELIYAEHAGTSIP